MAIDPYTAAASDAKQLAAWAEQLSAEVAQLVPPAPSPTTPPAPATGPTLEQVTAVLDATRSAIVAMFGEASAPAPAAATADTSPPASVAFGGS